MPTYEVRFRVRRESGHTLTRPVSVHESTVLGIRMDGATDRFRWIVEGDPWAVVPNDKGGAGWGQVHGVFVCDGKMVFLLKRSTFPVVIVDMERSRPEALLVTWSAIVGTGVGRRYRFRIWPDDVRVGMIKITRWWPFHAVVRELEVGRSGFNEPGRLVSRLQGVREGWGLVEVAKALPRASATNGEWQGGEGEGYRQGPRRDRSGADRGGDGVVRAGPARPCESAG